MQLPDWNDRTVVCVATGPSLTAEQVGVVALAAVADRNVRVIAINDAGLPDRDPFTVPTCDLWYAPDHRFWWHYREKLDQRRHAIRVGAQTMSAKLGLVHATLDQAHGGHAGIQALKLALDLGAKVVLLLGYDCRERGEDTNYFGRKPHELQYKRPEAYAAWVPRYRNIEVPSGSRVINCTPGSAIDAFPTGTLGEYLSRDEAAA